MANKTELIPVRMSTALVERIDAAIAKLPDGVRRSRSETIRWLLDLGLMVVAEMDADEV